MNTTKVPTFTVRCCCASRASSSFKPLCTAPLRLREASLEPIFASARASAAAPSALFGKSATKRRLGLPSNTNTLTACVRRTVSTNELTAAKAKRVVRALLAAHVDEQVPVW